MLVKYGADFTRLWNITWGNPLFDGGNGIAAASDGSVYCVGYANYGVTFADLVLLKFNPNGILSWNTTWVGSKTDQGTGVTIAPDGSVYCVGYTNSFGAGDYDLVLLKFEISTPPEEETVPGGIPGFAGFIALIGVVLVTMVYYGIKKLKKLQIFLFLIR
ncbi:MAG: hypothetical protein ACTSRS_16685 [Candidatus Helarchaeota archaeon]